MNPRRTTAPTARRTAPRAALAVTLTALTLALATALVYLPVAHAPFIETFDDGVTVTQNPHVATGLSAANARWALTATTDGSWQPLTLLSHMAVCERFGLAAGAHHVVNLVLHVLNVVLLLLVLWRLTSRLWPSAFVAGVFALHPLHVESVAWITERKDVLSTLFLLLALWAYERHARGANRVAWPLAVLALALGLACKPMLVTLPFLLVLLDWWPLGWLAGAPGDVPADRRLTLGASLREKWPMFGLAAAAIAATLWAQHAAGALALNARLPFATRLAGAALGYATYIAKLVVPRRMAFLYPWPVPLPVAAAIAAGAGLVAVSALAFVLRRRAPWAFVGWFWFAGMLLPVSGLVQTGSHLLADRFTYVPAIGFALVVAWAVQALARTRPLRIAALVAGVATLAALALVSVRQVRYWGDPALLFRHGYEVTTGNFIAHNNYAVEVFKRGKLEEARTHLEQAVALNHGYADAWLNLATLQREIGQRDRSLVILQRAVVAAPGSPQLEHDLAVTLAMAGRYPDAFAHFEQAIALAPGDPELRATYSDALSNWGAYQARLGLQRAASGFYRRALRIDATNQVARRNLALVPADSLAPAAAAGR